MTMANEIKKPIVLPKVEVEIFGRSYTYYMTDSKIMINARLAEIGCRNVHPIDLRLNPRLATSVREKMAEVLGRPQDLQGCGRSFYPGRKTGLCAGHVPLSIWCGTPCRTS